MITKVNQFPQKIYNKNLFERNPRKTIFISISLIMIVFDFILGIFFIPKDYNFYRSPHPYYHHGFSPSKKSFSIWGDRKIPIFINSLGFKDFAPREISLTTSKKRILFMGDSFTEGRGVTYGESFTGLINRKVDSSKIEIINSAVSSYCPKLYYLKTKFLLEHVGLKIDELYLFIDISDIQDEILYENFKPNRIPSYRWFLYKTKKFLKTYSFIYYSTYNKILLKKGSMEYDESIFPDLKKSYKLLQSLKFGQNRALWTLNKNIFYKWGEKGLKLAYMNIKKLYNLCNKHNIILTIIVYPWPEQIFNKDLDSIQVNFWRKFCKEHSIAFINLFPSFINQTDPQDVYNKYFINGDVHWNQEGHKLVATKIIERMNL